MKQNNYHIILVFSVIVFMFGSCTKKFDSINTDPDESTTSTSAWLATSMIESITSSDISSSKSFIKPFMLGKYVLWTEDQESYQYNNLGRADFSRLLVLSSVPSMISYAEEGTERNTYTALGHFIRAWQFFQTTMQMGDIPYSQAIQGESDENIQPTYDTQKEVFYGILDELDSANYLFSEGADFDGDFIYSGSVDQWRRLVNAFELHVLMTLSNKTSDDSLNVVTRFKDIVTNRPLMESYDDNFAVTYINSNGFSYPWCNTSIQTNSSTAYPMLSTELIDTLKVYEDRRLFYYAEPAEALVDSGYSDSSWNAYVGVEPSDDYSVTVSAQTSGLFCNLNNRYVDLYNAEPVSLLSYWDQEFILAEATVRGWISGTEAQEYYANGIQSSMNFLVNYASSDYVHGMDMTSSYIDSFPSSSSIKLSGGTDNMIRQIISQKYLAGFLNGCDFNAWYENRRTGYPAFTLNSSTNLNPNNTSAFPVRWMYPSDEYSYNSDNVEAAVASQFGGTDDNDQIMWILQ
ncbi:MAG: SusD/RagB family nutrient-binding outer membrane lipoprotein [Chitinophagaceae bacterium]